MRTTIDVYGDFKKNDVKVKPVTNKEQFVFQNILIQAGYDCQLHTIEVDEKGE